MDRGTGAYNTGAGYTTGSADNRPMGEKIKDHIPGTDNYQAKHGVDGLHQNVEKAKAYIPGTEENRMRHAGVTNPMHTGTAGGASMGQQIKQHMPGTNEYEATHGMDNAHRNVEQMKGYIPGTEEHCIREATHLTGHGVTSHDHSAGTMGTAYDGTRSNVGGTGNTAYNTAASAEQKSVGQKIKEHIPGTREHEVKKLAEERF